jgi:hypothetical protein
MVLKTKQRLEQWWMVILTTLAVLRNWLCSGWKEPKVALRWQEMYGWVVFGCGIFLAVKLTPVLQTVMQGAIQTVGNSLNTLFQISL